MFISVHKRRLRIYDIDVLGVEIDCHIGQILKHVHNERAAVTAEGYKTYE